MEQPSSIPRSPIWERLEPWLRRCLVPTGVLTAVWLVLNWLWSAGVHWGVLRFAAFLTGAFNGSDWGFVGGTIGKALYALCINELVFSVIFSAKTPRDKAAAFWSGLKQDVLEQIPHYCSAEYFFHDKNPGLLGCGALGAGIALLLYPFLTGGGALVNTSVCLLLAAALFKGLATDQGLFLAVTHLVLKQPPFRRISADRADRFLAGLALGMAVSLVAALCSRWWIGWLIFRRVLPWALVLAGIAGLVLERKQKEVQA